MRQKLHVDFPAKAVKIKLHKIYPKIHDLSNSLNMYIYTEQTETMMCQLDSFFLKTLEAQFHNFNLKILTIFVIFMHWKILIC